MQNNTLQIFNEKNLNSIKTLNTTPNLPNSIEKIILNNEINIHPIPTKLELIFCPNNVMKLNRIKKCLYKNSKKNFRIIK
jgi:hypothetical protein